MKRRHEKWKRAWRKCWSEENGLLGVHRRNIRTKNTEAFLSRSEMFWLQENDCGLNRFSVHKCNHLQKYNAYRVIYENLYLPSDTKSYINCGLHAYHTYIRTQNHKNMHSQNHIDRHKHYTVTDMFTDTET